MSKHKKARLNLYLNKDLIQFAKKWSYVTSKPISLMLEEYLTQKMEFVSQITPFQWLNDPAINTSLPSEDEYFKNLEDYLHDREEEEFCRINPDHPRARIRRSLVREHQQYRVEKLESRKEEERELIQRWMETFNLKKS